MTVTDIRPRRRFLTALFLDGEPRLVDTETLLSFSVRVGQELSEEEFSRIKTASDTRRAYEKALYLLEYRAHARGELVAKLCRTYPREIADAAADRVAELGLLDDRAFAHDFAEELICRKNFSPRRAAMELRRRGLSPEITEEAVSAVPADAEEQIRTAIRKKYGTPPTDPRGLARMNAYLARMGFSYADIRHVLLEFDDTIED